MKPTPHGKQSVFSRHKNIMAELASVDAGSARSTFLVTHTETIEIGGLAQLKDLESHLKYTLAQTNQQLARLQVQKTSVEDQLGQVQQLIAEEETDNQLHTKPDQV
jgi:hypothetical protein